MRYNYANSNKFIEIILIIMYYVAIETAVLFYCLLVSGASVVHISFSVFSAVILLGAAITLKKVWTKFNVERTLGVIDIEAKDTALHKAITEASLMAKIIEDTSLSSDLQECMRTMRQTLSDAEKLFEEEEEKCGKK